MDICVAWSGRAVGLHSRARVSDWGPVSKKPCASRVHGFSHCALAAIGLRSRRRWGDGECNVATSGRARGFNVGGTHLRVAGLEGVFTGSPHASHIAHHISVYSRAPRSAPPMVHASGVARAPRARAAVAQSSQSLYTRWCRRAMQAARLRRAHTSAILYTGNLALTVNPSSRIRIHHEALYVRTHATTLSASLYMHSVESCVHIRRSFPNHGLCIHIVYVMPCARRVAL